MPRKPIPLLPTDVAGFAGVSGPEQGAVVMAAAAEAFFANGGRRLHLSASLDALAEIDEITIVATPGAAVLPADEHDAAVAALLTHAEACGQRFAVVDGLFGATAEITAFRDRHESTRAALYHPWLTVADGGAPVAPSGAVAGVLARSAVHEAPAGVAIEGVTGLVGEVDRRVRDELNQRGVNLLRTFAGRGVVVWGARTMSADPDRRYVPVSRLLLALEHSIARGTSWAETERNDAQLWSAVSDDVTTFLASVWQQGCLQGGRLSEACFVRCDRTTMTQEDLDTGRLVCLVGVAPTRPAEFVTFRIGQWTADRQHD